MYVKRTSGGLLALMTREKCGVLGSPYLKKKLKKKVYYAKIVTKKERIENTTMVMYSIKLVSEIIILHSSKLYLFYKIFPKNLRPFKIFQ